MEVIQESLAPIRAEFERLANIVEIDLSDDPSDVENLEKYIDENFDRVIDILFLDPATHEYAKQRKPVERLFKSQEFRNFLDLSYLPDSYSEVSDTVLTFLDGEKSASLTYSFGFGDQLVQIFPQDKEYVDKVFRTHKKNVILGFGYFSGSRGISTNGGNLFSVNANVPNSKRLKERTIAIFQSTFGLKREDITLTKYKDYGLLFTFSKDGSDYLFYWVNLPIDSLKLLYFYKPMLDAFDERYLINTVATDPGQFSLESREIRSNKFIGDYFKASLFRGRGENIGTFQNAPFSYFLMTKNTIKGRHGVKNAKTGMWTNVTSVKNMWNGFGGTRKTRRRSTGAKARKQQTRGKK